MPQGGPGHPGDPRPGRQDQHRLHLQHPAEPHLPGGQAATPSSSTRRRSCSSWTRARTGPPRCSSISATSWSRSGTDHKLYDAPRFPPVTGNRPDGLKQMLDAKGPKAVADWVLGSEEAADLRHHLPGRPPVPAGHPGPHPGHRQGHGGHQRDPGGRLLSGVLGRRHLRRGLPLPPRVPLGAAGPDPGEGPQPAAADAAAGRQRRGLHQLSRQRHPGVHQGGRPQRHRRVPGVRLPELDSRHGSGHGRGPQAGQDLPGHHLLHRRHPGPQAGQVSPWNTM